MVIRNSQASQLEARTTPRLLSFGLDAAFCMSCVLLGVSLRINPAAAVGKKATVQTEPPSIPVAEFFPDGHFPEGEWQSYKDE